MKYLADFQTKWGFSDGEAVPPDAEAVRDVYVRVLNAHAEKRGSSVRAYAYDRGGSHNPYLLLFRDVKDLTEEAELEPDEIMEGVIEDLSNSRIDYDCVVVTVAINEEAVLEYMEEIPDAE